MKNTAKCESDDEKSEKEKRNKPARLDTTEF